MVREVGGDVEEVGEAFVAEEHGDNCYPSLWLGVGDRKGESLIK